MNIVKKILFLRSCDCGVSLILKYYFLCFKFKVAPTFSSFSLLDLEATSAFKFIFSLISPDPKIFNFSYYFLNTFAFFNVSRLNSESLLILLESNNF